MPTPVLVTGYEVGTVAGWTLGLSTFKFADTALTPAITAIAPRNGSYALAITGTNAARIVDYTTATIGATQQIVAGFAVKFPTLPGVDVNFLSIGAPSGRAFFLGFDSGGGTLYSQWDNGSQVAGFTPAADTWYWVDCIVDTSADPHTANWRVNGVAQTANPNAGTVGDVTSIGLGHDEAVTANIHYDDTVFSATAADYPLGPHKVLLLKADTSGTTTQIGTANATSRFVTNSTPDATHNSANILAAISEVPPLIGASATGVAQRTSGTANAVGIPMTSYTLAAGETISGVRIVICGWSASATANNIEMRAFDGNAETVIFPRADPAFDASTTNPGWMCAMYNPSGGWSQAKLDALTIRYGYSNDISPVPGAHAVYAEVAVKTTLVTAVGQVTETDTSQAFTTHKATTASQVTEADTAQAVTTSQGGGQTVSVGQVTETDTAQGFTSAKAALVGAVTESDAAQGVSSAKALVVGLVTETDTARQMIGGKLSVIGQVLESDTAQTMLPFKALAIGQATETDTSQDIGHARLALLGQVTENDTAGALAVSKTVAVGEVQETDTAGMIAATKATPVGLATETDTANAVGALKALTTGVAAEGDTAMSVTRGAVTAVAGIATEDDVAPPVTAHKTTAVGLATENDTCIPISMLVQGVMGVVFEMDTAGAVTSAKAGALGLVVEDDLAEPVGAVSLYQVAQVTEADTAGTISASKSVVIGQESEIDTSQPVAVAGPTLRGTMTDFGPCAPWEPIWCQALPTGSEAVSGAALQAATEILWQGTQQRFGVCTTTIRPCRRSCYGDSWPFSNMWWEFGTYPQPVLYAGAWYNMTCGSCPDTCSCGPLEETILPVPVQRVTQVMLGGSPMPTGSYWVNDNRKLVRRDGGRWPVCQNLVAPDTELNTWSVTVETGELVPTAGQFAVGELAIDYMKMCLGVKCEFPKWATSVTRADVQLNFPDFTDLLNLGLEGLPLVDRFLRRYNPYNLNGVPSVYDIDGSPSWTRVDT